MKIQKFNSLVSKSIAHNPGSMGPRNTFIYILSLSQFYFYFLSIWDLFWDKVGLNIPWVAAKLGNPRGRGEYKPQLNPHFFSSFLRFWHFSKPGKSTQKRNKTPEKMRFNLLQQKSSWKEWTKRATNTTLSWWNLLMNIQIPYHSLPGLLRRIFVLFFVDICDSDWEFIFNVF